jgi:hypothetical protein
MQHTPRQLMAHAREQGFQGGTGCRDDCPPEIELLGDPIKVFRQASCIAIGCTPRAVLITSLPCDRPRLCPRTFLFLLFIWLFYFHTL